MGKQPTLVDLSTIDWNTVVRTREQIRQYNPHRFEMELLTAVAYEDDEKRIAVGYQDVPADAFWCRGHMPGFPLMPGVIICECAAQLASYYAIKLECITQGIVGLGGLDQVKFRGIVRPGDRLVLITRLARVRHNMMVIDFEAAVDNEIVAEGQIKGIAIPTSV
ncbi:MAG: 3-hydroxyacyl-ACP dehydratase FabZ family protein [Planctomycetia bacterium]|nr:3-hydroxyacyl-ACP dehydratase FabZ family protein [Planctomycetia bacterium]